MSIAEIQAYIETIAKDPALYKEKNFNERAEALDFIEFHVIGHAAGQDDKALLNAAKKVKTELEEIDNNLFQKLQANIRTGLYRDEKFKDLVSRYYGSIPGAGEQRHRVGYDNLDTFINRLLFIGDIPEQTSNLEPEMVYYQKTPARIIFELAERLGSHQNDVFIDIGSGLGQACILVNLLTGIKTIGIEYESAFCKYADNCAVSFNLIDVSFINADASKADYDQGSVFFMYTPFWGRMLQKVLGLLKKRSLQGSIRVITYGPCTTEVARQNWLIPEGPTVEDTDRLAFFSSC